MNFRYSDHSPYVLRNINLTIEPGMSVALIGRTGSGKTTIISLLQKLYDVSEGEILIDGIGLGQIAPQACARAWRRSAGRLRV
ncbi:MAG: ATP-binding cassette domain-containing protein [Calothrix sp. SM1_5_4]|nr:ATP-binding cassette domain-containing protein [Calothrix sp. SM1_5_4]